MVSNRKITTLGSDELPRLQIVIKNNNELELIEFANSMTSLSDEYNRFLFQKGKKKQPDCKLYIHNIAEGSVIIDLIERAPEILPGLTPLLVDFSVLLVDTLEYLSGKTNSLPKTFSFKIADYININKIIEIAANYHGNSIGFIGINFGSITLNHHYTSNEAAAIQNQSEREIKKLKQSGDSLIREKVLLRLYQARDSELSLSSQGNLGIIEDIFPQPKVLSFANDRLRYNITKAENNPFNFTYIVDIEIKLRDGSLMLFDHKDIKEYEILKLHGSIHHQDLFPKN